MQADLEAQLVALVRASPRLMQVLRTARGLRLPDWRIVAGAIYQTVWNARTGRAPDYGIKDYDLAYYDASDISWEAEDAAIRRVAAAFDPPLRGMVEARNQARVHLWFKDRFGDDYPPLANTDEMMSRYVCPAFAVGVRLEDDDSISLAAPFGLADTFGMILRPNPARPLSSVWTKVIENARSRWPELQVVEPVPAAAG